MKNSLSNLPRITLTLADGVRIVVPDSLDLITPYVLREQQDWFEDEIKFLRRLLQPGQEAVDIGANYGVYTLSMARAVGSTGRVWAFEPASHTASLLAESIAANGFSWITLDRRALSSAAGTAQLTLNANSELNALVRGSPATDTSETVSLVSLDDCLEACGWRDIEVVKIDAEGEEANIIKGGERFFADQSPLVLYEVRAGPDLHLELVQAFASRGYDSYRLVPGLDVLVPFNAASQPDGYLLNLFCCKRDRASRLAARGALLDSAGLQAGKEQLDEMSRNAGSRAAYGWRQALGRFPYGSQLASVWERVMSGGQREGTDEALFFHAVSRDATLPVAVRYRALEASFIRFRTLCERQWSHLRLASLARVAREFGARTVAAGALAELNNMIVRDKQVDPSEPFLAPGERFESIPPGEAVGNWTLAAVLEELERAVSFSSFYTGIAARQRLEIIRDLGFGSAEMQRRLSLLQQRFGARTP